jgi:hypothetical protein
VNVFEAVHKLYGAWQVAHPSMKWLVGILAIMATIGWICAVVECAPKRKEVSDFPNTTGGRWTDGL